MDGEADLTFRPHSEEDLPFLHSSWGSSYYAGCSVTRFISPKEFHEFHRPIRERFFSREGARVLVCCDPNDSWHILGWIAVEAIPSATILQYLYIKDTFRREGLAEALLKRAIVTLPVFYTHLTDRAAKIIGLNYEKFRDYRHIPHLV